MTNSAAPDQSAMPTDLDLHCLLRQGMSCSAREELKGGPKTVVSKQKNTDYVENDIFMVIFLYNLYIFIQIQHRLGNMIFALDPSNRVLKWL